VLEGRFESFTLGRDLSIAKLQEMKRLYDTHGFTLSELRTPGGTVVDEPAFERRKRVFAEQLRTDPGKFKILKEAITEASLELFEPSAKGVRARKRSSSILKKRIAAHPIKKDETKEAIPEFSIVRAPSNSQLLKKNDTTEAIPEYSISRAPYKAVSLCTGTTEAFPEYNISRAPRKAVSLYVGVFCQTHFFRINCIFTYTTALGYSV
jgi:hypothetical protein